MFQLCLTRVLRERDLALRGEDTRMFGLLCAGCDSRPAWCDREWFRVVQRRTMSHTDVGIVGATTDTFILFENGVRRNRLVLPGLSNAADHMPSKPDPRTALVPVGNLIWLEVDRESGDALVQ